MTPEKQLEVRPVPPSATSGGKPRFGTYQGELPRVDLSGLAEPYRLSAPLRLLRHKTWQYTLVATPEVVALFSIADLTYSANAFAVAVDLRDRQVLFDGSWLGVPGPFADVNDFPGEGLSARFRAPAGSLQLSRGRGRERYQADVELWEVTRLRRGMRWKGEILAAGGAPALTVIAPVSGGGVVNVTQKWAGLLSFGTLTAGGRTFVLDGGLAGLDYTQGYLARRTAWRWAMAVGRLADGTSVGLNLVEGFNDELDQVSENALWIGNRLIPLGRARFEFNRQDPLDLWRISTSDGVVELSFRPIHVHREDRDLKLVRSQFVQPVGTFRGTLKVGGEVLEVDLAGVSEDQDILW